MPKDHHGFILALFIPKKVKVPSIYKKIKNQTINDPLHEIIYNLIYWLGRL